MGTPQQNPQTAGKLLCYVRVSSTGATPLTHCFERARIFTQFAAPPQNTTTPSPVFHSQSTVSRAPRYAEEGPAFSTKQDF